MPDNNNNNYHGAYTMKIIACALFLIAAIANAAEMQYQFNSPSFNGAGWSSHVLTIKQLEDQSKAQNKAAAEMLAAQAQAQAANTPQALFVTNLQGRIYSQLAKQITDSLFGAGGVPVCSIDTAGQVCGSIPDLAGNSVSWSLGTGSDRGMIIISINNLSNAQQNTTIKIPYGTFAF